ncbi:predicted protein [Aspergillus terreus NIH2624]|uniref:Uncharacterized protein n=1 Tax=Aspergillus terreus (strain NIH 2624 / FGSC A1156) TaxID=341663 RepID=Q0CNT8_ASPTN|nr:uncharacterized protein ATEG_04646 [Aspergillus terreus NIH2624]EAU35093.1 predicted protein [Aspergillus terreus NIH2624]
MAQPRLRMSDLFPDPNEDRSPVALDEATRALYRRAIDSPSSLTDEERRTIARRPPAPEEDEQCQQACGLTFSELVRKAIDQRDALSYREAVFLVERSVPGDTGRWLRYLHSLSEADQNLLHAAIDAAWAEDMREARANAHAVQKRALQASSAAARYLNDDDIRHVRLAMMLPWQEQVVLDTESEVCGLVGFYTDQEEWPAFQKQIETAIYHGLHYRPETIKDEALAKFTMHWIPIDESSDRDLREVFAAKKNLGGFPRGLRTDSFLFVDQEALQSRDSTRPFVWLWEPKGPSTAGENDDNELGPLKIDIKHIAPTLFARLTQRDFATEEARRKPYRLDSTLKTLHRVTWKHPTTRGRDGIWPAPARFM